MATQFSAVMRRNPRKLIGLVALILVLFQSSCATSSVAKETNDCPGKFMYAEYD